MSQMPTPAIRIRVDPTNPGEFFACCGLLELADRLWGGAEAWFGDGAFSIATSGTLYGLLGALIKDPATEMTKLDNGLSVKPLIAPLHLIFTCSRPTHLTLDDWMKIRAKWCGRVTGVCGVHFVLDAWMRVRRDKGEVAAAANPPWNFWSGQQTSLRIWDKLRGALMEQVRRLVAEDRDSEDLFSHRELISGRFGFDPGAAWKALDVGFSPDTQQIPVASSPAAEMLAAVGLQRFRPRLSDDRSSFYYATWGQPLSPSVASAAASGLITVFPATHFRGKIVSRGSYAALGYSTVLNGVFNG